jgi:hypothetical protein
MNFRPIATTCKMIALLAAISMTSCKKDDVPSISSKDSNAANLTDSSTVADNMYYDVLNNAFVGFEDNITVWNVKNNQTGTQTTLSTTDLGAPHLGCAIYTISDSTPGSYPKTLTLDFGTGCSSVDGILRKGKLTYQFSGPLLFPGTTVNVTFSNYVVNGYGLAGVYKITNNSSESAPVSLTTQVTNGIITYPNLSNYHYSHNKTYIQKAGLSTLDMSDDVYSITGNSSFTASDESTLVFNVTTPLVKAFSCHNISAGVLSFTYDQSVTGSIDFGDSTCDNLATVTVGTISRQVILR